MKLSELEIEQIIEGLQKRRHRINRRLYQYELEHEENLRTDDRVKHMVDQYAACQSAANKFGRSLN